MKAIRTLMVSVLALTLMVMAGCASTDSGNIAQMQPQVKEQEALDLNPYQVYSDASSLYKKGDYAQSLKEIDKLLKLPGVDGQTIDSVLAFQNEVRLARAKQLFKEGMNEGALSILEIMPLSQEVYQLKLDSYIGLGNHYQVTPAKNDKVKEGNLKVAQSWIEKALQMNQNHPKANFIMGMIFKQRAELAKKRESIDKNYKLAGGYFEKAYKNAPSNTPKEVEDKASYGFMLAEVCFSLGDVVQAVEYYKKVADSLSPQSALYTQAIIKYRTNKRMADEKWMPKTLFEADEVIKSTDPGNPRLMNALIWKFEQNVEAWNQNRKEIQMARDTANQIIKIYPRKPIGYRLMGNTYFLTVQNKEAEKWFDKALDWGKDIPAYNTLLCIRHGMNSPECKSTKKEK